MNRTRLPAGIGFYVALFMLTLLLAGCSGGDDASNATPRALPTVTLESRANAMLLKLADYPLGWSELPPAPDDAALESACPGYAKDRLAHVSAPTFGRGPAVVSQGISIYSAPDAAETAVDDLG
jgi:hypothetical protein